MQALRCDLCGGGLIIDDSREFAVCEFCGTKYMASTLRQKIQEIKGTVSIEGEVAVKQVDFVIRAGVLEKYNGSDVKIAIPKNVTIIGAGAFEDCKGLTDVEIPDSVTEIDNRAFCNCVKLKKVVLPKTLQIIGDYAFAGCESLENIDIPNSVTDIGNGAFKNCRSLLTVTGNWMKFVDELDEIFFGSMFLENYSDLTRQRRADDLCQYCGGTFKGLFSKICTKCGKPKDY